MKITHRSLACLALVFAAAAPGCKSEAEVSSDVTASSEMGVGAEASLGADAIVEEHEGGTVAWNVAPDGNVRAAVMVEGKPVQKDVTATLVWKAGAEAEAKTVPLTVDAKTGFLVGAGPKLEADITEVNYTINVNSKPWSGALHVPVGGTAQLVANAKASVDVKLPEGNVGPNGGVVQVVGKDRVELVADETSGEVRVYVLDADFKAVAVGERSISLGVYADAPHMLALASAEGGAYFRARWSLNVDPLKITIAVRNAGVTSVALVGYRPGARLVVRADAPRLKVRTKTKWAAYVDGDGDVGVGARGRGNGHAYGHDHAPAFGAKGKVDVDAKAKANANANAKAKVDVKAPSVKVDIKPPKIEAPKVSLKAGASAKAGAGAKIGK
jgi:hypothetical protein